MMNAMSLVSCLGLNRNRLISMYGAGGKTTLIYRLAAELAALGKTVLVTTTTRMYPHPDYKPILVKSARQIMDKVREGAEGGRIYAAAAGLEKGKLIGFEPGLINELKSRDDLFILIEADGSKRKPLKGFAAHEPVIPAASDLIIPLAGFDAFDKPLTADIVHRLPELLAFTGAGAGEISSEVHFAAYFDRAIRLGVSQAPESSIMLSINKSDLLPNPACPAWNIARLIKEKAGVKALFALQAEDKMPVKAIFPFSRSGGPEIKIAAIILAAGSASRMGKDKLAMPFQDTTILQKTVEQVRAGGLDEIILVVQPGSSWPEKINFPGVRFAENGDYQSGQASSVRAGLNALAHDIQAAVFVLADQPTVEPEVYRELTHSYRSSLKAVTCPVYNGNRGNPVIFDRLLWPELLSLSGDTGGRAIINRLPAELINAVPVRSGSVLLDIDTAEDYRKFVSSSRKPRGEGSS